MELEWQASSGTQKCQAHKEWRLAWWRWGWQLVHNCQAASCFGKLPGLHTLLTKLFSSHSAAPEPTGWILIPAKLCSSVLGTGVQSRRAVRCWGLEFCWFCHLLGMTSQESSLEWCMLSIDCSCSDGCPPVSFSRLLCLSSKPLSGMPQGWDSRSSLLVLCREGTDSNVVERLYE